MLAVLLILWWRVAKYTQPLQLPCPQGPALACGMGPSRQGWDVGGAHSMDVRAKGPGCHQTSYFLGK